MIDESRSDGVISVIVPIYNVEKYLRQCIDSIIAQTYKDLEIILVDDGSPDMCPQICDEYAAKDSRIKVIHKTNGGLSEARNVGLEAATGEFIGFVDSDDFILPDMYDILYRACVDNSVSLAMCGRKVINDKGKIIRYEYCMDSGLMLDAKEAIESLLVAGRCDSAAWDKLYKRDLFSGIRYPVGVHFEDQNVTARLFYRAGKIYHVGQALYVYLKRRESITGVSFNSHSMDEVKQAELLKDFLDIKYPDLKNRTLFFVHLKMGFPLSKACRCKDPEMRIWMREVSDYSRRYFPYIMRGPLSLIRKIWFFRNYFILKLRLLRWSRK